MIAIIIGIVMLTGIIVVSKKSSHGTVMTMIEKLVQEIQ